MEFFVNLLRIPDDVKIKTPSTPLRFEEKGIANPVKAEVRFEIGDSLKVILEASEPVEWIRLRFDGDLRGVKSVLGDAVERCTANDLVWSAMLPHARLPWYFHAFDGERLDSYGVKTGANSFAYFQPDPAGITLWLDVRNGGSGVELTEPLLCAEIVCRKGISGEDPFIAAREFCKMMCPTPNLAKSSLYGFNNWYWAYGGIDEATVLHESEYLASLTSENAARPYMVIDDGWQITHSKGYNGGRWDAQNERFSPMNEVAAEIKSRGCRPGIWLRPLLTMRHVPTEAIFASPTQAVGTVLDPTHPFTLEAVGADISRIASWGFELIKHDFSTYDLFGNNLSKVSGHFYDRSKTNAAIVRGLYETIQRSAGNAVVLGCNTVGHLAAGIHQAQRVGDDTSGRSFEWTRRHGIHSMMRLPQTGSFYSVDPDCAAFTPNVSKELNFDFLEASAISGCAVFASVTPGILTPDEEKRMSAILGTAATLTPAEYAIPTDWTHTTAPGEYLFRGEKRSYDWYRNYRGARNILTWFE